MRSCWLFDKLNLILSMINLKLTMIRWKVTSKEALAQISEYSEAGITVRGTYYAPGKPGRQPTDYPLI